MSAAVHYCDYVVYGVGWVAAVVARGVVLQKKTVLFLRLVLRGFALLRLLRGLLFGCVVLLLCVLFCCCIVRSMVAGCLGRGRRRS